MGKLDSNLMLDLYAIAIISSVCVKLIFKIDIIIIINVLCVRHSYTYILYINLIFTTTLRDRYNCYFHFITEKNESYISTVLPRS